MNTTRSIYRVNWLVRLPLKTPYPAVIARIQSVMAQLPRGTDLVIDFGGVGRGIYDMIVDAGLNPIGVTMTGGFDVHWAGQTATVPKSTLVSKLVARLHAGELFVHGGLGDWPVLRRELENFRPEVTRAGTETWNARSGQHDDLVIAVALCVWYLEGSGYPYKGLMDYYREQALGGRMGPAQWCVGVDIGQSVDPTAICVMSKIEYPSERDVGSPEFKPGANFGEAAE
jgi:hypothetical protein